MSLLWANINNFKVHAISLHLTTSYPPIYFLICKECVSHFSFLYLWMKHLSTAHTHTIKWMEGGLYTSLQYLYHVCCIILANLTLYFCTKRDVVNLPCWCVFTLSEDENNWVYLNRYWSFYDFASLSIMWSYNLILNQNVSFGFQSQTNIATRPVECASLGNDWI